MLKMVKSFGAEVCALPGMIHDSVRELHSIRALTGGAMLTAVSIVIHQFTTAFLSQLMRISVTFLPIAVSGMLYGPVLTGSLGAMVDILRFFVRNNGEAYFIGFTISEFAVGFLYGIFLYRKQPTLPRVFLAKLAVTTVNSLILNPLWLSILYGQSYTVLVAARLVKNAIMLPIETAMLYFVLRAVVRMRIPGRV